DLLIDGRPATDFVPEQRDRRDVVDRATEAAVLPEGQQVDAAMRDQLQHAAALQRLDVAHQLPNFDVEDRARELGQRADTLDELAQMADERADDLTVIHQAREAWYDHTNDLREQAREARQELDRRHGPEAVPEQAIEPDTGELAGAALHREVEKAREAQRTLAERATSREAVREEPAMEADRARRDEGFAYAAARQVEPDRDLERGAEPDDTPPPPAPEPPAPEPDIDLDL
ncbi:MAG: hypothetical protein HOV94_02140, partial [Saccharothrix sp.]|nr:hypothetical protein [Saccharothrix sp.]